MVDKNAALLKLNDSPEARFWKVDFELLTWPERVFRAIWGLDGEVNNGGFDQFYYNSSGDLAYFVPEALDAVGADATAGIVREANALFPPRNPLQNQDERQRQLDALTESAQERMSDLDRPKWRQAGCTFRTGVGVAP